MRDIYRQSQLKRNLRGLFAVAFLFVLLAEWSSHSLAFAHAFSDEGQAVHSRHDAHEDLCKTLIRCSEGPRQEQQASNFGHDLAPQSIFSDRWTNTRQRPDRHQDPRIYRSKISALFRHLTPPFHPPEFS